MNKQSRVMTMPAGPGMYSVHIPKMKTVGGTMKRAAGSATRSLSSGHQAPLRRSRHWTTELSDIFPESIEPTGKIVSVIQWFRSEWEGVGSRVLLRLPIPLGRKQAPMRTGSVML